MAVSISTGQEVTLDDGNLHLTYIKNDVIEDFNYTIKITSNIAGSTYVFTTEEGENYSITCQNAGETYSDSFNSSAPTIVAWARK